LPTKNVGSWLPRENVTTCNNPSCALLPAQWLKERKQGMTWLARQSQECETCEVERKRKCRLFNSSLEYTRH
jgi:hypothetical protein